MNFVRTAPLEMYPRRDSSFSRCQTRMGWALWGARCEALSPEVAEAAGTCTLGSIIDSWTILAPGSPSADKEPPAPPQDLRPGG